MPRLVYDLESIKEGVEHGKFRARLKSCTEGPSKTSGNPTLTFVWELREGPDKGAEVRSWASRQANALFSLKQHLMAFGYNKKVDVNTDRLVGKEAFLIIGEREGTDQNGQKRMFTSVNGLLPLKSGRVDDDYDEEDEPYDEAEEEEDEEEQTSRRKAPRGRTATSSNRRRRPEPEDDEEDDEDDEDWDDEDDDEEDEPPRARSRVATRRNGNNRRR